MANRTPRRFTGRATEGRRLGRLTEGSVDSSRTYGKSIDPGTDGRLEVKTGPTLKVTPLGLEVNGELGDKNRIMMIPIDDLDSAAASSDIVAALNLLLQAQRDTKRMRTI